MLLSLALSDGSRTLLSLTALLTHLRTSLTHGQKGRHVQLKTPKDSQISVHRTTDKGIPQYTDDTSNGALHSRCPHSQISLKCSGFHYRSVAEYQLVHTKRYP